MAETAFSIASRELLCSSDSNGSIPPASTIDSRFSAESDARLASAAAACSCAPKPPLAPPPPPGEPPTASLMLSSAG